MTTMRQVTQKEFYEFIFRGNYDCHPRIVGNYPYRSEFAMRYSGRIVGIKEPDGTYWIPSETQPSNQPQE